VAGIENADGVQTMDHRDFRILGLAGSLRRASFHRGIGFAVKNALWLKRRPPLRERRTFYRLR
jgi:hypothetical protein